MTFQPGSERHTRGMKAEDDFVRIMTRRGHEVVHSSKKDDMFGHFDFHVSGKYRMDVKGPKKVNGKFSFSQTWVEIENQCRRGNTETGWLWADKPTHFAFKQNRGFLIITKKALQEIVKEKYSGCTKQSNDVKTVSRFPTEYHYTRGITNGWKPLKNEKTILVDTALLRARGQLVV